MLNGRHPANRRGNRSRGNPATRGIKLVGSEISFGPGYTSVITTKSLDKAKGVLKSALKEAGLPPTSGVIQRRRSFQTQGFLYTVLIFGKAK